MATVNLKAYTQALTTALSTELNSLANGSSSAASTAIDNTGNLDLWLDAVLSVTFGSAPTASNTCDLYLIPAVDGSTYADGGGSVAPAKALLVGSFELRAVTTAQKVALLNLPLPPALFKLVLANNAGVAFPSSGSTLSYRTHSLQSA